MPSPAWFSGLDSWWSMEEITYDNVSGTLTDHSGNGHDGFFLVPPDFLGIDDTEIMTMAPGDGLPWHCSYGIALHATVLPAINPIFDLRGNQPYQVLRPSGGAWYDPSSFSLAIWMKYDGPYYSTDRSAYVSFMELIGELSSNGASDNGWRITSNAGVMEFTDTGGLSAVFGTISDSDWHCLGVSSNGTTFKTYLDGSPANTYTQTGFARGGEALKWGMFDNGGPGDVTYASPWNGQFGDTLMWDRALSDDDWVDFFLGLDCAQTYRIRNRFYAERGTVDLGDASHPGA